MYDISKIWSNLFWFGPAIAMSNRLALVLYFLDCVSEILYAVSYTQFSIYAIVFVKNNNICSFMFLIKKISSIFIAQQACTVYNMIHKLVNTFFKSHLNFLLMYFLVFFNFAIISLLWLGYLPFTQKTILGLIMDQW